MEKLLKLIEAFEGDELDDEFTKAAEKSSLSATDTKALRKQLKILDEYRENFPSEVNSAIAEMAKQAVTSAVAGNKTPLKKLEKILKSLTEAVEAVGENQEKIKKAILGRAGKKGKKGEGLYTQKEVDEIIDETVEETMQALGIKKSADDDEDDEDDDEDQDTDDKDEDEDNDEEDEDEDEDD